MPWVRAMLRGQKVYARADESGKLVATNGRVEVRYKPHDGRRYEARAENLAVVEPTPLPDDTCGEASAPPKGPTARAQPGRSRTTPRTGLTPAPAPEGAVVAYCDGACSNNPGPAGLGVVIVDGDRRLEISEFLGDGLTNNIAELTAALRVFSEVDPARPLVIHTDSQYTIGVVEKGWKAKANVELVAELREALGRRANTRFVYVRGHAGVPLNERADALARQAIQSRRTRREVLEVRRPVESEVERKPEGGV